MTRNVQKGPSVAIAHHFNTFAHPNSVAPEFRAPPPSSRGDGNRIFPPVLRVHRGETVIGWTRSLERTSRFDLEAARGARKDRLSQRPSRPLRSTGVSYSDTLLGEIAVAGANDDGTQGAGHRTRRCRSEADGGR